MVMRTEYPAKVLLAWGEAIMGHAQLRDWLIKNGYPELGIFTFAQQFTVSWGQFAAASVLIAIPIMALFLYSSKWLISGLTLGSVKG